MSTTRQRDGKTVSVITRNDTLKRETSAQPVSTRAFKKANVSADTCQIISIIAATQGKYIYEIIEEAVRSTYPEYFKDTKIHNEA